MSNVPDAGAIQRTVQRTGETDRDAYYLNRYWALVNVLNGAGYPMRVAGLMARMVLPQLVRETGTGRYEWNYNIGNIKGSTRWGQHRLTDGQYYRSYPTLVAGVADYLRLISTGRYRAAWDGALSGRTNGAQWYAALMNAGYNPYSDEGLAEWVQLDSQIARHFGGQ